MWNQDDDLNLAPLDSVLPSFLEEMLIHNVENCTCEIRGVPIIQALYIGGLGVVLAVAALGIPDIETCPTRSEIKYISETPKMEQL